MNTTTETSNSGQQEQYDYQYELFKHSFQAEFGCEYPGAKWDTVPVAGDDNTCNENKDNRPLTMETKTLLIKHDDDGTIETITEVTITRPDGSRETMRRTNHPEKCTRNWTHPNKASNNSGKEQ